MNKPTGEIRAEGREIDRIDTGPRFTEHDAVRLNRMFRGSSTEEMLEAVLKDGLAGEIAAVSSFGAESAVLLHLIGSIDPNLPTGNIDVASGCISEGDEFVFLGGGTIAVGIEFIPAGVIAVNLIKNDTV